HAAIPTPSEGRHLNKSPAAHHVAPPTVQDGAVVFLDTRALKLGRFRLELSCRVGSSFSEPETLWRPNRRSLAGDKNGRCIALEDSCAERCIASSLCMPGHD